MTSFLQAVLLVLGLLNVALMVRFYRQCVMETWELGKELIQNKMLVGPSRPSSIKLTLSEEDLESIFSSPGPYSNLPYSGLDVMSQGFTRALDIKPFPSPKDLGENERIQLSGALALQHYFHSKQIEQCRVNKALKVSIYRMPYTHRYGLFSQILGIAHSLLDAVANDHVLSWRNTVSYYIDPARCSTRSFECVFLPITTCDDDRNEIVKDKVRNSCAFEMPWSRRIHEKAFLYSNESEWRDVLPRLRSVTGLDLFGRPDLFNAQFFAREALRFVTRPNDALVGLTRDLLSGDLAPPQGWSPLGSSLRRLAVHIRAGDDKKGHTGVLDARAYARLADQIGSQSLRQIVFSSDDPVFQQQFLEALKNRTNPQGCGIGDVRVVFIPPAKFGSLAPVVKEATISTNSSFPAPSMDTGMLLMAQIFIFASADAAVGLFASNVALTMHMYSSAMRHSSSPPIFDVGGSPWPVCNQFNEYPLRFMRHPALYGVPSA